MGHHMLIMKIIKGNLLGNVKKYLNVRELVIGSGFELCSCHSGPGAR